MHTWSALSVPAPAQAKDPQNLSAHMAACSLYTCTSQRPLPTLPPGDPARLVADRVCGRQQCMQVCGGEPPGSPCEHCHRLETKPLDATEDIVQTASPAGSPRALSSSESSSSPEAPSSCDSSSSLPLPLPPRASCRRCLRRSGVLAPPSSSSSSWSEPSAAAAPVLARLLQQAGKTARTIQ